MQQQPEIEKMIRAETLLRPAEGFSVPHQGLLMPHQSSIKLDMYHFFKSDPILYTQCIQLVKGEIKMANHTATGSESELPLNTLCVLALAHPSPITYYQSQTHNSAS
jgi:hypothetical protein